MSELDSAERSLFDFESYKAYLLWREQNWPSRGMRRDLAAAMGCQAAYVSQILNGTGNFSLEQLERASSFLAHTKAEMHFFLLLAQTERAGTQNLRKHFLDQIESARKERVALKNRFDLRQVLSKEDQVTYYSQSSYALVHIALTVPSLQSVKALASRFVLPEEHVSTVLDFLVDTGLATQQGSRFLPGPTRIHLGHDSNLIVSHHRNWRLKAIDDLAIASSLDLHYSSVVSLSASDFNKVRESLARAIERTKKVIRDSPEEALAVFNIDFFKLKR